MTWIRAFPITGLALLLAGSLATGNVFAKVSKSVVLCYEFHEFGLGAERRKVLYDAAASTAFGTRPIAIAIGSWIPKPRSAGEPEYIDRREKAILDVLQAISTREVQYGRDSVYRRDQTQASEECKAHQILVHVEFLYPEPENLRPTR